MLKRLYHNPNCSKSRQALALLQTHGGEFEVVEYLKTPLDQDELNNLFKKLKVPMHEFVRTGEAVFKSSGISLEQPNSAQVLETVQAHPILMQRPILEVAERAVIGRPPENVLALL